MQVSMVQSTEYGYHHMPVALRHRIEDWNGINLSLFETIRSEDNDRISCQDQENADLRSGIPHLYLVPGPVVPQLCRKYFFLPFSLSVPSLNYH